MFDSFATPWTVAHQTPLSMGIPGENTGVDCHYLLQGIFLIQGSKPMSPALPANSLLADSQWKPSNKQLPNPAPYRLKALKII